jgi:type VII secretion effector (TIGR04197 family)
VAEVRVAPAELAQLARSTLDTTKALATAHIDTQAEVSAAAGAFGSVVPGLHSAHQAVVEAADTVLEGLVSTLEQDVDNLYRVALRYKDLDEQAAAGILKAGSGGTP